MFYITDMSSLTIIIKDLNCEIITEQIGEMY